MVRPFEVSARTFKTLVCNKRSYASVVANSVTNQCNRSVKVNKTLNKASGVNNMYDSIDNNVTSGCVQVGQYSGEVNTSTPAIQYVSKVDNVNQFDRGHTDTTKGENENMGEVLLYDVRATDDKFIHSVLFSGRNKEANSCDSRIYHHFQTQSKYTFGFVPLSEPIMPSSFHSQQYISSSIVDLHTKVKQSDKPIFWEARIPVSSQLKIENWELLLRDYWDQQLLQFFKYGFPLGFNRNCPLQCDIGNHKSANEFPLDVQAYLDEELEHGAIAGPFKDVPIKNCHISPFMTHPKANSDTRRVIIDLSWPKGYSVNDGVDKSTYMGTDFHLTFPTIDDLTTELVKLGRGAHLYKIDVSRAFRHLPIDPFDYDLLGLYWDGFYLDKNLPFGTRHGSQFFQRTSDTVRYVMRQGGFDVLNYIDDFLGFGVPSVAKQSFDALFDVMLNLGLTISQKKLVPPSTKAVCLGIKIDTVAGTLSIPEEKFAQIKVEVTKWSGKKSCTKRQLQSLLGLLLYICKCVRPAKCFLNRMLETLRQAHDATNIALGDDFHWDLLWFQTFLKDYNGVSMYEHKKTGYTVELDACLTGLGGACKNMIYHVPIPIGYRQFTIVHLVGNLEG